MNTQGKTSCWLEKKTNDKVDQTNINKEIEFLKKSFKIERQELEDLLSQP